MAKKKKSTPRLQVDDTDNGAVLPCPLCEQNFWRDTPNEAWKQLYNHLRWHHDSARAAELTQKVRKKIWRLNWEKRQKDSTTNTGYKS